MIGSKFSRHFFNQSEVKPKPIVARACTFSRALCRLRVITSSFDWFAGLSQSFLIGQSNYFGFGFTTLNWNSLYNLNGITKRNPRCLNMNQMVHGSNHLSANSWRRRRKMKLCDFMHQLVEVCTGNGEVMNFSGVYNRPNRLTQCCTQFKPFGNETFCSRYFHII